ncbi:phosphoribosyltransferase family protein [Chryseobacterium sp. SSA4.19]|uniref:phosphoribosyltransferase family protein n=1 Tax=Chryseobacterium sp. SSA4.19 TaxID=2919915 RepID=UPI001F4D6010|nr:phosphoribosyltransferase family protein [Chryseobacterium sp. SSA4.19]MCJ8153694.1 phosphoribosyltransferase family protein [Chryseobacterium sp. SSA4.19]
MNKRYSLHHIHSADEFTFSPEEYSYFKYGDKTYAEKFAKELFDGFISQHAGLLDGEKEIVVLPSPYMAIPTASNFLCFYFKKHLDFYLFKKGRKSSTLSKINRNHTYTTDYGNLSFEDRKNLISNDTYYLDKDFLRGKLCIFIDDIKITGSHEYTVNKILEQYNVEGEFLFMYYAELMNFDLDPKIENFFNYYAVKSVEHIAEVMIKPGFQFNTRIVKYILGLESGKFEYLSSKVTKEQMDLLLELAISNNYHLIKEYENNINTLTQTELYYGY